ncbi:MAG: NAD(P)-dependent alcohol dehydrogenase [Spartobacteria bacterium]|nr:NAD(P)-dependent alcohol dehydrogenase [Spartobacteria bacterium]
MKAVVLEKKDVITIRDMPIQGQMTADSVRIAIKNVGICGSDVHYLTHGRIGPFVVEQPMILGHEAGGVVLEVGKNVKGLSVGNKVCMEPGIPNAKSRPSKIGMYNLDPDVQFWATPPVHGCLIEEVIHPAEYTFKLPDNVSLAEGAMVEPLAIGLQAAKKADITPGDVAVVIGAGTIGIMCAISAIAGGCSRVFIADMKKEKLDIAGSYPGVTPILVSETDPVAAVLEATQNWGADIVIEASGAAAVFSTITDYCCPGGTIVSVGMPVAPVPVDMVMLQSKELTIKSVFRYANMYPRAIELIASGQLNVKPLISEVYPFEKSIEAFERATEMRPTDVKIQIEL